MTIKFRKRIKGERLTLVISEPTIEFAQTIFDAVDRNSEHLQKWLPWVSSTKRVEDSMRYLFEIEEEIKVGKKVNYGLFLKDVYIGNIGVFDIDIKTKSAEIGYWLDKEFTGKGYMGEAVKLIEREFFEHHKFNRLQIKCDEQNKGSAGVARSCKFRLEGTLREDSFSVFFNRMRNTQIYSKLKLEYF